MLGIHTLKIYYLHRLTGVLSLSFCLVIGACVLSAKVFYAVKDLASRVIQDPHVGTKLSCMLSDSSHKVSFTAVWCVELYEKEMAVCAESVWTTFTLSVERG